MDLLELGVSLWLLCGLIAVITAYSKGQKALTLQFAYVALGPVGLALAMKQKQSKTFCPYCNESVVVVKDRCSLCGLDLSETGPAESEVESNQCPRCGKGDVHDAYIENGSWGKWCPHCKMSVKKIRGMKL